PLPGPPQSVIDDPNIRSTLEEQKPFLKTNTLYDIEKLSTLLVFHPNRLFVESVLEGLKSGFWPCHSGDWNFGAPEFDDNYTMELPDLDAVRNYRDKEIAGGHWSRAISSFHAPMKLSPMFVVWQGDSHKAQVITDQTASGLNSGVPKQDAHVRYDDMRSF
ncbi:hypothetical protein F5880DRAFT_1450236, partial [Lentinula raphanica]